MKAPTKYIDAQQKEALIVMITILFIEEHGLLRQEDLEDAKKSLQALFLRATGQATLLTKLIEVLRATRNVHQTFASIFNILTGIGKGVTAVDGKLTLLRESLDQHKVTAEEYRDFIDLFLSFSQNFHRRLSAFARDVETYVGLKENEAKLAHIYRIARDARNQLRDRLKGELGSKPRGKTESRIKDEVVSSFNYGESRESLELAIAESHSKEGEVLAQLEEIKAMCQMAMNPAMRERPSLATKSTTPAKPRYGDVPNAVPRDAKPAHEDIFARLTDALEKHPALERLKEPVVELFRLYQNSYGMFALDWNRLQAGIQLMVKNTEAYFEAKEEDKDIRAKREKLRRIESLIPFLERGAKMLDEKEDNTYTIYTRRLSEVISEEKAAWASIAEDLLRAKVHAEAEMSTKL
jgi:hypothetical protein